jgi:multidrug resistance protein, MATE family
MKTKFLTEASAMWQLAWPVLIGQLASVGMGAVDVAMTGHLSANDLAAVALGAALWTIVLVTMMGVMMATNTLVAHEVGAQEFDAVARITRQSLWLGVGVGIVGCVLLAASSFTFDWINIDPWVREKATNFVWASSLGLPAFACYRALYGYTTSLNQTKPVMLIAVGGLLFNIGVNWLLVFGNWGFPQLGATGCAIATSIGMWLMLGAMIWWIRHAPVYRATNPFTHWEAPDWAALRGMLRLGLPIGITLFAEVSAFSLAGLLMAGFGVVTLSAHQITLNFSGLVFMVPMSVGIAVTTRVGQALGEGDPARARYIAWVGIALAFAFAAASSLFIFLFREQIAAVYTSDVNVQMMTVSLLLFAAIFQLADGIQVCASSAIRGYKVTTGPMLIQLFAFWLIFFPLGSLLAWSPWRPEAAMGGAGFWLGLTIALVIAAVLMLAYLVRVSRRALTSPAEPQA